MRGWRSWARRALTIGSATAYWRKRLGAAGTRTAGLATQATCQSSRMTLPRTR